MLKEKHCTEGFSWDNIEHVNVTCWRYGAFYSLLDNASKYYVGTWVYYPKENVNGAITRGVRRVHFLVSIIILI